MAEWQTRSTQNRVPKGVWVQVPLRAPGTILRLALPKQNLNKTLLAKMRALKILVFAEATSFLILLLIAMPLKYMAGLPAAVKIAGWIHGLLFVLFCACLAVAFFSAKINLKRSATIFVASLIPFAPFCLEWKTSDS
jgi:integral membrane protein